MEQVKEFFQRKEVKTWFWQAFGTFLSILAIYLGDIDPNYGVVIVPTILAITKYINKKYL
jgi:hypothetical protein